MDRRRSIAALIAGALSLAARSQRQAGDKIRVVGLMANSIPVEEVASRNFTNPAPKVIEDGLRELGWVEGRNVRLVWKTVAGRYDRWPEVVRELVTMRVDVIVVFADGAAKAAIGETRSIPVVHAGMGTLLDPKIIDSLQRPGGNLTGVSVDGLNLGAKRLELLKSAVPSVSRVALLQHAVPADYKGPRFSAQTQAVASNLKIEIFAFSFDKLEDLPRVFSEVVAKRANGMLVGESSYLYYREYQLPIHELLLKHRIPAMYRILNSVESGGLMAYAPNILDLYRAAPRYIDKIFKGAKPAELPIEAPRKFDFVINLRTARAMGIKIPSLVLALADRVIE
ncbi:MAG TPA: ABC transporter substrate-binding protein [Usitatibacter sp.]|nr:ABC transporter substrate-binding protein [Usitatibacter sp.]